MEAQYPRYARPQSATRFRVPLVPEFAHCSSPNETHVSPLNLPSCSPPGQTSAHVTTSHSGTGWGFAKFVVTPGDLTTPTDEADVHITAAVTDVQNESDGADYTGDLILSTLMRQTDVANEPSGSPAGTVQDVSLSIPLDCAPSTSVGIGSNCVVDTTLATLVPGWAKEGKSAVISALSVTVLDAGDDGNITLPSISCALTCGTGDEQVFLRQGLFTP
jgi:hypothetical protein